MAKKTTPYLFAVKVEDMDAMGVGGALDMLRYDVCTVRSNPPRGYDLLSIESGRRPTMDRWKSLGCKLYNIDTIGQVHAYPML
jgi:hypothetical protein